MSYIGVRTTAVTDWAVFTTFCRAFLSAAVELPYQTVTQLFRMLSTVDV